MIRKSINIKNMVCPRCITAVEQTLKKLNIEYIEVKLGEAIIMANDNIDYNLLDKELNKIGFELIMDNNVQIVEQIKSIIIKYIHHNKENELLNVNFSDIITQKIGKDYSYISKIFSENENITIEKYIISQKIERVKELISYNELNFSEIAFLLHYSSPAHLSKQFKNITGLTLSQYKKQDKKHRKTLDKL
jgi:AraC-like DNA-binding protein